MPTTDSITAGSNQITNVSNPTAWAEGDRIQSKDGIPEGTLIVKIEGNTFTIGSAATATKSAAKLYDAPYVVINTSEHP